MEERAGNLGVPQRTKGGLRRISIIIAKGITVAKDDEKADVLNAFFPSVFKGKVHCPQDTKPPEQENKDGEQKEIPTIQEETVNDLLHHLDIHKSKRLINIHQRVLRELVRLFNKPLFCLLSAVLDNSEIPVDWNLANVTPIHKRDCKKDLGNYRPVNLTVVPGKVMEQITIRPLYRISKAAQGSGLASRSL